MGGWVVTRYRRELRQGSIDYLSSLPFDGYALGGSMGKLGDEMVNLVEFVMPQLPQDKPNHLLGIAGMRLAFLHLACTRILTFWFQTAQISLR